MSPRHKKPPLDPTLRRVLRGVRWRIRSYVWLDGFLCLLVWLGLTFWVGLALDYLPVLAGASEMPRGVRALLLTGVGIVSVYLFYRGILRRTFVRLRDRNMALLLERTYPQFQDSLLTEVESHDGHWDSGHQLTSEMLSHTRSAALNQLNQVRPGGVINWWPLGRRAVVAASVVASVLIFGVSSQQAFLTWVGRFYRLDDTTWTRRAHISVVGFEQGPVKIGRGTDHLLRVRADASRRVPRLCTAYYRTDDGERGRLVLNKRGPVRDGEQAFVFDGRPFRTVQSNVTFDVVGFDHRVRDCRLQVVELPTIIEIAMDATLPDYTGWLPRRMPYRAGTSLPEGSDLLLTFTSNKNLERVTAVTESDSEDTEEPSPGLTVEVSDDDPRTFRYQVNNLRDDLRLQFMLDDTDGVSSPRPYSFILGVIPDQAPRVDANLVGIGSAITPEARLPIEGEISDDYAVARAWADIEVGDTQERRFDLKMDDPGTLDTALDLQSLRDSGFALSEGQRIVLSVQAADRSTLDGEPNVGQGDRYELEIVSSNRLLALLEARELGLRRRLEQIISELEETRDSLSRVHFTASDLTGGAEPDDQRPKPDQPAASDTLEDGSLAQRNQQQTTLRKLRVERARQHSQRSAHEVIGVAAAFEDIRAELINNRIDSQDRQQRLLGDIAQPLNEIGEQEYPPLTDQLIQLEQILQNQENANHILAVALIQTDDILARLRGVLDKMLDLESYNELVDLLRSLIDEQNVLIEKTKARQKQQALELLE